MPGRVVVCQLSACLVAAFAAAAGASPSLELSKAWAPAAGAAGADVPVHLTTANHAAEPDSLLRFRCPAANLTEQRTTDYGEDGRTCRGAPPAGDEEPVGGLLIKERCEKTGDGRRLVLDRQLFRRTGRDLKDVVESTRVEIFARADEDRSVAGAPGRCQP